MRPPSRAVAPFFFAALLLGPWDLHGQVLQPGDWIELQASHPEGVPLHERSENSFSGERAPDGSIVAVLQVADNGHWIQIDLQDGRSSWIIERYVRGTASPPSPVPPPDSNPEWLVWGAKEGCDLVVQAGGRMAARTPEALRIGTWNVRWFPDETDLDWLACTIAWMNLDVLGLQEIRDTPEARQAMQSVIASLNSLTSGSWEISLHECGSAQSQHTGFLWDASRVSLESSRDLWHFNARANPSGSPCAGSLRPGRYGYLRSTSGTGVDLHLLSVHLKSGSTNPAREERAQVFDRFDLIASDLSQMSPADLDLIVIGDFNTMGSGQTMTGSEEIQSFRTMLSLEVPGFTALAPQHACTEYYQGHGGLLDHFVVVWGMAETEEVEARVTGYCAVKSCADLDEDEKPAAYQSLSDHCPTVIEIKNEDLD